jgi:hypothetical protein
MDRANSILHPGMPGGLQSNIFATAAQHQAEQAAAAAAAAKAQAALRAVQARIAAQSSTPKPLAPTAPARALTPAATNNVSPGAAKVLSQATINTPTISQAQAKAANWVAQNGGYQTNIQSPHPTSFVGKAVNVIKSIF